MGRHHVAVGICYLLLILANASVFCTESKSSLPGYIHVDRVDWNIGSDINITCVINLDKYNGTTSANMSLEDYNTGYQVPKEDIVILNSSSILYTIHNASKSIEYLCKCGDQGVNLKQINVGTPPQTVTDFKCRGYDYKYFTCRFAPPPNAVLVKYTLRYKAGEMTNTYKCELQTDPIDSKYHICNMTRDEFSSSRYHTEWRFYKIFLNGINTLGEVNDMFTINHFDSVVPAKLDVEFKDISPTGVVLSWQWMMEPYYKTNIVFKLRIRPDGFNWTSILLDTVFEKKRYTAEVNGLEYPFLRYDVEVRAKVKSAADDDTMWSEPFKGNFTTAPRHPDFVPKTDVGSFLLSNSELHLYWNGVPKYRHNGDHFHYKIDLKKNGELMNTPRISKSLITEKFAYTPNVNYEFVITSVNDNGTSNTSSVINVPKMSPGPRHINKVLQRSPTRRYTLSWSPPEHSADLVDYTVFWCIQANDSNNQCNQSVEFLHFDKNTTNFTREDSAFLDFAVSANYKDSSSGMNWALCTALEDTVLTKLEIYITPQSSTTIKVIWNTECIYTPLVQYYNLAYCHGPNKTDCTHKKIDRLLKTCDLSGLRPYTEYKVTMVMHSKKGSDSPASDPIIVRTHEAAPSPPRNLTVSNIKNNSVDLAWYPPKDLNGELKLYTIHYNNEEYTKDVRNFSNDEIITFTLGGLKSYWLYNISVSARTNADSLPSNVESIRTDVGKPSAPRIVEDSDSDILLKWAKPEIPAGHVDFYEILSTVSMNGRIIWNNTTRGRGSECMKKLPVCHDGLAFKVKVRAVNVKLNEKLNHHDHGALKRRRHSNPEIHLTQTNRNQQLVTGNEYHPHIRKERDYTQLDSTTEGNSILDGELTCVIKPTDDDYIKYYNSNAYELLYSDYLSLLSQSCSERSEPGSNKKTVIAITSLATAIFLMAIAFFISKKCIAMNNIKPILPLGLDDVNTKTNEDIINNTIAGSRDSLCSYKENESLLAIERSLDKRHEANNIYDISSDTIKDDMSTRSTDSVELNDCSNSSYSSSPKDSPGSNIRDMCEQTQQTTIKPSSAGYIQPTHLNIGYVLPSQFQKPPETSFSGYVTPDAMGKLLIHQPTPHIETNKFSNKEHNQPNINENICGYVTHKQLSDFGQQQHLQ